MSIAALVRTLLTAGVDAEVIVAAVASVEGDLPKPETGAAERMRRYRARRNLTENEWKEARFRIRHRDGPNCGYCGKEASPFHIDHVVPLSRGGSNDDDNLIVTCASCNQSKCDKTPDEWSPRQ